MKNHYFQMDDRALWLELRSGSLIALEVIYLKSATPFPKCYLHKEKWTFDS